MTQTEPAGHLSLRERKKLKTRLAIQDEALRLFLSQGYDGTTVDQIAEAAGVSPATFYRYFPTKEDAVLFDSLDPVMLDMLRAQPTSLSLLTALRRTSSQVFEQMSPGERKREEGRQQLVAIVPELRSRQLSEMARGIEMLADVMAEREGLGPGHPRARAWAGAVVGVVLAFYLADPERFFLEGLDSALQQLEDLMG